MPRLDLLRIVSLSFLFAAAADGIFLPAEGVLLPGLFSQLSAQDRRGGDDRGRDDDRRRGDDRGGSRGGDFRSRFGGGFPGGGSPGGGFPGGGFSGRGFSGGGGDTSSRGFSGGFNPSDMLRRLDTNNNGMIDPSEAEGRSRYLLERFTRDVPGVDLSRPIPIDRLTRAIDQSRGDRSRGDDSRSSSTGRSSRTPVPEPLVPGFGIPDDLPPPLPFGVRGPEEISVVISDEDRREAEDRLRRYDGNRDGVLDREEIGRNRWSDDPFAYDRNRDGKLTVDELAARYAKRRESEGGGRGSSSNNNAMASRSSGPSNSSGSSSTNSSSDRMAQIAQFMLSRYDRNGNGQLEKDEWSASTRTDLSPADANRDGRITKEELSTWFASRSSSRGSGGPGGPGGPGGGGSGGAEGFAGRGGFGGGPGGGFFSRGEGRGGEGRGDWRGGDRRDGDREEGREGFGRGRFGGSDGGEGDEGRGRGFFARRPDSSDSENSDSSSESTRAPYRASSITERLPKGLPSWFTTLDTNTDGQIAMAEFSASWSDSIARNFAQFDLNGDGFVTPQECLKATERGVARTASSSLSSSSSGSGSSGSYGSSFRRTSSESARGSAAAATPAATSEAAAAPAAASSAPVDQRYMAFAVNWVKKYDTDNDGVVSKEEWSASPKDPSDADADKDGKITPEEYARWSASR